MHKRSMAPWPAFDEEQVEAASRVLRSGEVSYWSGTEGREFEREFAQFVGVKNAVALANGTVALELALRVLGVGEGDEVIVPARTFIATASSVVASGARPVVADIDMLSGCMTAQSVEACLTSRTRALIVVHLGGWPADMDSITALARERGLKVIEDCAQAHGAQWRDKHVGSFGDIGVYSFCNDKIMTTAGEGGALLTDDDALWRRAWEYKDHGKDMGLVASAGAVGRGSFKWVHRSFGSNYRLSEVQAAVGRVQLSRLPAWLAERRANARNLDVALADTPGITLAAPPAEALPAYYRYYFYVDPAQLAGDWDRDKVIAALLERGVPCQVGSCSEIYREEAFSAAGFAPESRLPGAAASQDRCVALYVHPGLGAAEMDWFASQVDEVMTLATRTEGM